VFGLSEVDRRIQQAAALYARNERAGAEALLTDIVAQAPDNLLAQTRLAEIEIDRRQAPAAERRLLAVLRKEPNFAPAWAVRAHAAWLAGRPLVGLRHARRAFDIQPGNPQTRLILAQLSVWLYRHAAVPALLGPLIAEDQPDRILRARALSLLGEMHVAAGDPAAADRWLRAALDLAPELVATRVIFGMNRLRQGDFATGLAEFESRRHVPFFHPDGPPRHAAPAWNGQSLAGRSILLEDEQGFGDAIQFFRYLALLRDSGATRIVLKTFPPLVPLLQPNAPWAEVVSAVPADFHPDVQCHTSSLPFAFGTRLETIPASVPYLAAPRSRGRPDLRLETSMRKRVGLAWSGDPRHLRDHLRSIPAARFLRLADRTDFGFVSLQVEVRPTDRDALGARPGIVRMDGRLADYADTASVTEQLDLVICVDTSVAHLAGALGRPVWILLPLAADWRWLTGRTDSPWYPNARLFRAGRGGWGPVLRRMAAALDQFALL
jgi:tetratricopeptide (TPR) repeat protein